ncbi:hypothetical protein PFISCL1PPCAC_16455 [Pristionchus fissidentatus]|uniref:mitogen-activated protein kinase kinase n=1 Tax=Pristionchus fissidentatus TaxID=1538716 RepID=A0AAV5W0P5_9BILA|nr:hypothetical protein PFISCL1PPCAC_16455 [Pristionchus fissidentatus]
MSGLEGVFARMKLKEQQNATRDTQALIASDNGKFHVEGEAPVNFTVNDLELADSIGVGFFTEEVVRAVYKPNGMEIAVKKIKIFSRPTGRNDGHGQDSMIREASNFGRAAHANVVRLHGFYIDKLSFTCYICMEMMHANLDEVKRVAHNQDIPGLSESFSKAENESFLGCVTVSIVNALSFLRNVAKVMHRDLKPNNIMVNDKGAVKLCDFGVSKKLQSTLSSTRANTAGVGCLCYMAPERFDAVDGYGSKSEVWSFGITLFECATGRNPYEGNIDFVVSSMIKTDDAPRIEREENGYGLNLRNFVDACLFKPEDKRASLSPSDSNCLQCKKFYKQHAALPSERRNSTVMAVLDRVTPHLPHLRKGLIV